MFSVASLLALLAFSITGSPVEVPKSPITLPMTRRPTFSNVTDILHQDEARVAAFREYSTHGRRADVLLLNMAFGYTVIVSVGFPSQKYNLIVDSFSSITWVGARTRYKSRTGVNTEKRVAVNYGYGSFEGTIYEDTLSLTDKLTIPVMPIGVASTSRGIGFDGVLGIGPTVSSRGALTSSSEETIRSVADYLYDRRTVAMPVVGIYFQPSVINMMNYGELTIGGVDSTKYTSTIRFTDITTTTLSSHYWGIDQSITYGDAELMPRTAGIVDCGSTFLYIASDAYERYRIATGGIVNRENRLLQISADQYDVLDSLRFHIGEQIYSLNANAQIWPRALNHMVSGGQDDIFLVVRSLDTPSGTGVDFINGYVFLQRFYTVFDAGRSRIGFAKTQLTDATSN
ncbi:aspartic peptidase domain-containing protein [Suillus spraguei]|nr:aspartic peptidase domain-containing protein [Suillus spraguei]